MLDLWLALVCHQRPDRLVWLAGSPLPVCARCAGLYLSLATAALVLAGYRASGRHVTFGPGVCLGAAMMLIPAALHPVSHVAVLGAANPTRFVVGAITGLLLVVITFAIPPVDGKQAVRSTHLPWPTMAVVGLVALLTVGVLSDWRPLNGAARTLIVCGAALYVAMSARLAIVLSGWAVRGCRRVSGLWFAKTSRRRTPRQPHGPSRLCWGHGRPRYPDSSARDHPGEPTSKACFGEPG